MGGIYWIASYPKSGNTWFRVFLQNLCDDAAAPADINRLDVCSMASVRGWLDEVLGFGTAEFDAEEVDRLRPEVYRWAAARGGVQYHKIHDACWSFPDGEPLIGRGSTLGAVYLIRNPLDVAASYAHHNATGIDEAIATMACESHVLNGSDTALRWHVRQRLFSWSRHVLSWVDAEGLACHVVRYEDMHDMPFQTFEKAARFLSLPCDSERLDKALRFSTFDELARQEKARGFRERPVEMGHFFRRGGSGTWRRQLSPDQVARVVRDHGEVMHRFGYLSEAGEPL